MVRNRVDVSERKDSDSKCFWRFDDWLAYLSLNCSIGTNFQKNYIFQNFESHVSVGPSDGLLIEMQKCNKRKRERKEKEIVAKASDGQRYPLPLSLCLVVCDCERGSGPEGADDVSF